MDNTSDQQIVPGISVTTSGQATVDPSLTDVLFDLAIKLEEPTNPPVDVEHVLAAIVLAARNGELDADTPLTDCARTSAYGLFSICTRLAQLLEPLSCARESMSTLFAFLVWVKRHD